MATYRNLKINRPRQDRSLSVAHGGENLFQTHGLVSARILPPLQCDVGSVVLVINATSYVPNATAKVRVLTV